MTPTDADWERARAWLTTPGPITVEALAHFVADVRMEGEATGCNTHLKYLRALKALRELVNVVEWNEDAVAHVLAGGGALREARDALAPFDEEVGG